MPQAGRLAFEALAGGGATERATGRLGVEVGKSFTKAAATRAASPERFNVKELIMERRASRSRSEVREQHRAEREAQTPREPSRDERVRSIMGTRVSSAEQRVRMRIPGAERELAQARADYAAVGGGMPSGLITQSAEVSDAITLGNLTAEQRGIAESIQTGEISVGKPCTLSQAVSLARKKFPKVFAPESVHALPPTPKPEADAVLLLTMRMGQARQSGQPFDQPAFELGDLPRCTAASRAVIEGEAIPLQKSYFERGMHIDLLQAVEAVRAQKPHLFDALRPKDDGARYVPLS